MSSLHVIRNLIEDNKAIDLTVGEIWLLVALVRLLHVAAPVDRGEARPVERCLQ